MQSVHRPAASLISSYVALTKPPIIVLLLITALGGMILAEQAVPSAGLVGLVMLGGALAAGGASALNHYLDRDIDERMSRTRRRPIPARRTSPREALVFGIVLNCLAFAVFAAGVNLLSAALALSGTVFYVLVYTVYLKRTTPQNIVLGGAAGAVPPMVGWAAVTNEIGLASIYLFAIVFFWTPPHFWALALLIKEDYARAGVPMLPVVQGTEETRRAIFLYSLVLVALTLLFFTVQTVGWVYFGVALALGGWFIYLAWLLWREGGIRRARQLYLYSLAYLALLFGGIMVDAVV
jgi:protoheme IX farnesyltransferase